MNNQNNQNNNDERADIIAIGATVMLCVSMMLLALMYLVI